ncbi:MAG: M23 family metallopeptidase [Flammeovirgaceae bacterium]
MELSIQQIDFIEADIKKRGLTQKKLRGEILDHICCAVEEEMRKGQLFHKAYLQVLSQFGDGGLSQLQAEDKKALNGKRIIKKAGMVSTSIAACLMIFVTSIGNAQEVPSISPLKGNVVIHSGFGMRIHPIHRNKTLHRGVDFKAPMGTPIYATADAVVKKLGNMPKGYGKYIMLAHGETYETLYAHLSEFSVEEGDKVKKGEVIGLSGNSGMSTKPHLHYEVRQAGKSVDPVIYMSRMAR